MVNTKVTKKVEGQSDRTLGKYWLCVNTENNIFELVWLSFYVIHFVPYLILNLTCLKGNFFLFGKATRPTFLWLAFVPRINTEIVSNCVLVQCKMHMNQRKVKKHKYLTVLLVSVSFQNVKQVVQKHIPLVEVILISTFCNQQILNQQTLTFGSLQFNCQFKSNLCSIL